MNRFDHHTSSSSFRSSSSRNIFSILLDSNPLSKDVQLHLSKVYGLLTVLMGISAFGCYFSMFVYELNVSICALLTIVFSLLLYLSPSSPGVPLLEQRYRLGLLLTLGFFEGAALAPIVYYALSIDPNIIFLALLATTVVFVSFSAAALYSERREFLYLGGVISSLTLVLLINSLFYTRFSFNVSLYGGLIMFILYVLYDTQMIVEKVSIVGSKNADAIHHALELFIDFVQLFVRILTLLSEKEKKKNNNRN
nr:unnamed protein product [Naegleria fowleri]